jgi:site-specific DNA recombinase
VLTLLHDPKRLEREYNRRLHKEKKEDPARLEGERKNLQNKITRMIDSYADGLISKDEFEPRVKRHKAQLAQIDEQCRKLKEQENSVRQLQLLIVRLDEFVAKVKGGLDKLDWNSKRQLIRSLVKTIEIDHDAVNVVFRVGSVPFDLAPKGGQSLQHCNKRGAAALRCSFIFVRDLPIFQHARAYPLLDETHNALVRDSVLDELDQPFVTN